MSDYQHVLLAIDYSRQTRYIAQKAQKIAAQNHAKLSIVHVIEHIAIDNDYMMENLLDAEQMTLAEIANDLNIATENQWLRAGIPAKEIVELAKEQSVDLIVMGAHQHKKISRLLGFFSHDALEKTPCDLLSIRLN